MSYLTISTKARSRVAEIAENAQPLNGESGRPKNDNDSNQNHYPRGGENVDYLTARIARDNPEILEGMKQGKYRSVRAAAIVAGWPKTKALILPE